MTNKTFYLDAALKTVVAKNGKSIKIAGYANTVDRDRTGDVVLPSAWAKGVNNFRKNPILLFQHKHDEPIGRVNKIRVDPKGIFVEATVSSANSKVHRLVSEGALKSFSVGFLIKDQKHDSKKDVTTITEVELLEISVVSIPANQESLFSVRKAFDTETEYQDFIKSMENEAVTKDTIIVGTTSKQMDHYHAFELDEEGNGWTTYTSHGYGKHTHEVKGKVVGVADDHDHEIKLMDNLVGEKNYEVLEIELAPEEIEEDKGVEETEIKS